MVVPAITINYSYVYSTGLIGYLSSISICSFTFDQRLTKEAKAKSSKMITMRLIAFLFLVSDVSPSAFASAASSTLNQFCGLCEWERMPFDCDFRVKYLVENYGMTVNGVCALPSFILLKEYCCVRYTFNITMWHFASIIHDTGSAVTYG